jgi:ketosteroid isomerase-like protein
MKTIFPVIIFSLFITSCDLVNLNGNKNTEQLLSKDKEFSDYSLENGLKEAFFKYADSAAVLLKPEMMPVKGVLSIRNYYRRVNDSELKLSWVPLDAVVARSNDLGYTYGIWELSSRDSSMQGTYVTVWKKDESGEWKYVLDSGNDGLGFNFQEDE